MQSRQIVMTVLGLLLGAFGLVLLNFGNTPTTSIAAVDYSSTWTAKQLYRLHGGSVDLGGIGVKKWEVTGQIGGIGGTTYTETWVGPPANSITFSRFNLGGGSSSCKVNADPKLWLGSCLSLTETPGNSPPGNYSLTEEAVDSIAREGRAGGSGAYNAYGGSGAYCYSRHCWSTLGTYGFGQFSSVPSNQNGTPIYIGIMMPLQWTVTGTIQD